MNKFMSFLMTRFPTNYLFTFTDWLKSLDYATTSNPVAFDNLFTLKLNIASTTITATTTAVASIDDINISPPGVASFNFFAFCRSFSSLFIALAFIVMAWNFINWVFVPSSSSAGGASVDLRGYGLNDS